MTESAPTRRFDRLPEDEANARFFDLRETGNTGPINQDGYAVTAGDDARILRDMAVRRGEAVDWWTGGE